MDFYYQIQSDDTICWYIKLVVIHLCRALSAEVLFLSDMSLSVCTLERSETNLVLNPVSDLVMPFQ